MAITAVEICNLAISNLGTGKEIASIDENSAEANACRRYYATALEETLRGYAWPFANKVNALQLVEENPTEEWGFSYGYPVDCLQAIRIVSGNRNEALQDRIEYKVTNGESSQLIFTDQDNAILEYTIKVEDPSRFPSDFKMALSFLLSVYIAPRLTKGDPYKMGDKMMRMFDYWISKAATAAYNEEQPPENPESAFVRARE
jgi:hypothetical protein